jgi:hypothetical protein
MTRQPDNAPALAEEPLLAAAEIAKRIARVCEQFDSPDPDVRRIARVVLNAHVMDLRSVLRDDASTSEDLLTMALVTNESIDSEAEIAGLNQGTVVNTVRRRHRRRWPLTGTNTSMVGPPCSGGR